MQRKASEQPGKLRICHVDLRLITVVSHLVPFPTEHSTRVFFFFFFFFFFSLSYGTVRPLTLLTPFYFICHIMLRLSRRVKFKNIKWHIHGDKFRHVGAVTIVNNIDHTQHYSIDEEINFPTFSIISAAGFEKRGCYYFKGLSLIQMAQKCLICMDSAFRPCGSRP